MKVHIFMIGLQSSTLDIEKKIPHVIKTYPNAEVKKKTLLAPIFDIACIEAKNIASNLKIAKILEREVDLDINIDCYGFSDCSFTLFDISFDLEGELIKLFLEEKDYGDTLMRGTSVKINGEIRDFPVLIMEHLAPYFDFKKTVQIMDSIEAEEDFSINSALEKVKQELCITPFMINGPNMNMTIGPYNTLFIIEDYKNETDISNEKIVSATNDNGIYVDNDRGLYFCKEEKYYQSLWNYHLIHAMHSNLLFHCQRFCQSFLNVIRKKAINIRSNIDEGNNNSHYWKQLKKTVEIMDLNFLEFHTLATKFCIDDKIERYSPDFTITDKYEDRIKKRHIKEANKLKDILNEVKYAINNLSTPSHAHDEAILQKETEKVNDRILMLSFIAMAVSAIGMMRSNDIKQYLDLLYLVYLSSTTWFVVLRKKSQKNEMSKKN